MRTSFCSFSRSCLAMLLVKSNDEMPMTNPTMMITTRLRNENIFVENFFFTSSLFSVRCNFYCLQAGPITLDVIVVTIPVLVSGLFNRIGDFAAPFVGFERFVIFCDLLRSVTSCFNLLRLLVASCVRATPCLRHCGRSVGGSTGKVRRFIIALFLPEGNAVSGAGC